MEKRIVPMYNLEVHTVMMTVVNDAQSESKIGKVSFPYPSFLRNESDTFHLQFNKRTLDIVGIGSLEPTEHLILPSSLPSASHFSTSSLLSPRNSMIDTASPRPSFSSRNPSFSDQATVQEPDLLSTPTREGPAAPVSSSRPKTAPPASSSPNEPTLPNPSPSQPSPQINDTKIPAQISSTDSAPKKLFSKFFKKRDLSLSFPSLASLSSPSSSSSTPGIVDMLKSTYTGITPSSSVRDGGAKEGVKSPSRETFGIRPGRSVSPTKGLSRADGSIGTPTLGTTPTVRGVGKGTGKVAAYHWTITKLSLRPAVDPWSFASLSDALALATPSFTAGGSNSNLPTGQGTLRFEWVRGKSVKQRECEERRKRRRGSGGAAEGIGPGGSPSRSRGGSPLLAPSNGLAPPSPLLGRATLAPPLAVGATNGQGTETPIRRSIESRFGDAEEDGENGKTEEDEEEEEDPEDSETPWFCSVVGFGGAEGGRMSLGTLSPAPHHPKSSSAFAFQSTRWTRTDHWSS